MGWLGNKRSVNARERQSTRLPLGHPLLRNSRTLETIASELEAVDLREPEARGRIAYQLRDLAEALATLDKLPRARDPLERVRSLLGIMREAAVHPWTVKSELDALIEAVNAKPSLADLVRQARDSILEKAPGRQGPGHEGPDTTAS